MSDKIALVTGANKSIGFEVVRALAAQNNTVYLGSQDEPTGRSAVEQLAAVGDVRFVRRSPSVRPCPPMLVEMKWSRDHPANE